VSAGAARDAAPPPGGPARTDLAAVAAAFAAGIMTGFYVGKMPSALPLLKAEFDLSLVVAGWVVSLFNVVGIVGAVLFGIVADRVGALRLAYFGLASMTAGGLVATVANGSAMLLASRALESAGFVSIVVGVPALILAATAPRQRGLVLGIWSIYLPAGASVAIAAAPWLLPAIGWRGVWLAVAALTALVLGLLAARRTAFASLATGQRRTFAQIRAAMRRPEPWLLGAAFACYAAPQISLIAWLPTYLIETRGVDPVNAALLNALFVFMNVIGCIGGGFLVHLAIPRGILFTATFAALVVIDCGIFLAESDAVRYASALAFSLVGGVVPAASLSGASRYARSPAEAGIVQGLVVQVSNSGNLIGPPAMAAAVEAAGRWDAAIVVPLAAAGIGIAVGLAVLALERRASRGSGGAEAAARRV
jgi:predicted MFS family arabinose efflux permease